MLYRTSQKKMRIHGKLATATNTWDTFTVISDVWWDTGLRYLAGEGKERERAGGEEENISILKFNTVSISGTEICALDHSKCVCVSGVHMGQSITSFDVWKPRTEKPDPNDLWSHYHCVYFNQITVYAHTQWPQDTIMLISQGCFGSLHVCTPV